MYLTTFSLTNLWFDVSVGDGFPMEEGEGSQKRFHEIPRIQLAVHILFANALEQLATRDLKHHNQSRLSP